MAIKIAKATETSPESWFNMQSKLDLWKASRKKYKVMEFSEKVLHA
jgi:plasmid maintenance system antidote protein VapI